LFFEESIKTDQIGRFPQENTRSDGLKASSQKQKETIDFPCQK
jgi:hypothetical protein